jgi:transcriptional regulator with XRE-family HTH domain
LPSSCGPPVGPPAPTKPSSPSPPAWTPTHLSKIETGKVVPSLRTVHKVAVVLDLEPLAAALEPHVDSGLPNVQALYDLAHLHNLEDLLVALEPYVDEPAAVAA